VEFHSANILHPGAEGVNGYAANYFDKNMTGLKYHVKVLSTGKSNKGCYGTKNYLKTQLSVCSDI